jgi:hypothetical protein
VLKKVTGEVELPKVNARGCEKRHTTVFKNHLCGCEQNPTKEPMSRSPLALKKRKNRDELVILFHSFFLET